MRRTVGDLVCLGIMSLAPLSAQTASLMSAGYGAPVLEVAPGQVITLYISGTKTILPSQSSNIHATAVPLPPTLGGFSVTLRQGTTAYVAPLLSVVQTPNCTDANPSPQCITTALTVQMPFEITPPLSPLPMVSGDLSVNDNGTESGHFPVVVLMDNIHILTSCDLGSSPLTSLPCAGIVTHADGTMVSGNSPAKAGETVVVYAYGLGQTTPAVRTGVATPTPAPSLLDGPNVTVQFDFRPNAGPAMPHPGLQVVLSPTPITIANPVASSAPLFVGLTPGQVGLYQINVRIPDAVPPVPACTLAFSCLSSLLKCLIQSNLTIDIGGVTSFDAAAICVQPGH